MSCVRKIFPYQPKKRNPEKKSELLRNPSAHATIVLRDKSIWCSGKKAINLPDEHAMGKPSFLQVFPIRLPTHQCPLRNRCKQTNLLRFLPEKKVSRSSRRMVRVAVSRNSALPPITFGPRIIQPLPSQAYGNNLPRIHCTGRHSPSSPAVPHQISFIYIIGHPRSYPNPIGLSGWRTIPKRMN